MSYLAKLKQQIAQKQDTAVNPETEELIKSSIQREIDSQTCQRSSLLAKESFKVGHKLYRSIRVPQRSAGGEMPGSLLVKSLMRRV